MLSRVFCNDVTIFRQQCLYVLFNIIAFGIFVLYCDITSSTFEQHPPYNIRTININHERGRGEERGPVVRRGSGWRDSEGQGKREREEGTGLDR